jgi:hypothetical protein
MNPCICSVGFGGWYPKGVSRLYQSLTLHGYTGDKAFYSNELPPGSPPHYDVPYAFKLHAIKCAFDSGNDVVLWADASMYAIAPVTPILEAVEKHGYILFRGGANTAAMWTHDACLSYYRTSRDAAEKIPQVVGGLVGFSKAHALGASVFEEWYDECKTHPGLFRGPHTNDMGECSKDPHCRGHRHDQSVLSLIAHKHQLRLTLPPKLYTWNVDETSSDTVFVNRGM